MEKAAWLQAQLAPFSTQPTPQEMPPQEGLYRCWRYGTRQRVRENVRDSTAGVGRRRQGATGVADGNDGPQSLPPWRNGEFGNGKMDVYKKDHRGQKEPITEKASRRGLIAWQDGGFFIPLAANLPGRIAMFGGLGSRTMDWSPAGTFAEPVAFHITPDRRIGRHGAGGR